MNKTCLLLSTDLAWLQYMTLLLNRWNVVTFTTVRNAHLFLERDRADVVVVDVAETEIMVLLWTFRHLAKGRPPIIAITNKDHHSLELFLNGANASLHKERSTNDLERTIHSFFDLL